MFWVMSRVFSKSHVTCQSCALYVFTAFDLRTLPLTVCEATHPMRVRSVFCLFFLSLVYSMSHVTRQETRIYIRLYIILFQNMRVHSCLCSVLSHVTSKTLYELCHVTSMFWVMLCLESRHDVMSRVVPKKKTRHDSHVWVIMFWVMSRL